MNLVEYYIKEIHSVKQIPHQDWMKDVWVEVEMTVNCHGNVSKKRYCNTQLEFERDLKRGYYMG